MSSTTIFCARPCWRAPGEASRDGQRLASTGATTEAICASLAPRYRSRRIGRASRILSPARAGLGVPGFHSDLVSHRYSAGAIFGADRDRRQSRSVAGAELADKLAIERARLVHMLDHLQKRGLIERLPSPTDRRTHALELTGRAENAQARESAGSKARGTPRREARQRRASGIAADAGHL